jgi:hypothetical protein
MDTSLASPTDWRDRVLKRLSTTPVRIRQDILGLPAVEEITLPGENITIVYGKADHIE